MDRLLAVLLLLAGFGCESAPTPVASPQPRAVPEPAPQVFEESADEVTTPDAAADPDALLYAFVDGCFNTRADSTDAALAECRRLRRRGRRWQRRQCDCRRSLLIEVRASDPIAYYQHDSCWFEVGTREEVTERCEQHERRRRAPEAGELRAGELDECDCSPEHVTAVRGPYERSAAPRPYESITSHVYLSSQGSWLGVEGEPPCFVAGTAIATPEGPRAIEELLVGDMVLGYDADAESVVTVEVGRVKSRVAEALLAMRFTGGHRFDITPNHPVFFVDEGEFRPAESLRVGDRVLALDGGTTGSLGTKAVSVESITRRREATTVYNIGVERPHDYFAAGVLVHNY